jgi:hypothetical protein
MISMSGLSSIRARARGGFFPHSTLNGPPAGPAGHLDAGEPGVGQPSPQADPPHSFGQPLVVPVQRLPAGQHRAPAGGQYPRDLAICGTAIVVRSRFGVLNMPPETDNEPDAENDAAEEEEHPRSARKITLGLIGGISARSFRPAAAAGSSCTTGTIDGSNMSRPSAEALRSPDDAGETVRTEPRTSYRIPVLLRIKRQAGALTRGGHAAAAT